MQKRIPENHCTTLNATLLCPLPPRTLVRLRLLLLGLVLQVGRLHPLHLWDVAAGRSGALDAVAPSWSCLLTTRTLVCRSAHQPAAQLIRTLSLRLAAMHACCSALVTDRYASDRSVYLPTMAMVTGWGSGLGGRSKGEGTRREQHHGVWEPYQSWCTH